MNVIGIIPTRFNSSRFQGKFLVDIAGKSMVQRVYEQAVKAKSLSKVWVATDDQRIFDNIKSFDGNVVMTASHHINGTQRCEEVIEILEQDMLASGPRRTERPTSPRYRGFPNHDGPPFGNRTFETQQSAWSPIRGLVLR